MYSIQITYIYTSYKRTFIFSHISLEKIRVLEPNLGLNAMGGLGPDLHPSSRNHVRPRPGLGLLNYKCTWAWTGASHDQVWHIDNFKDTILIINMELMQISRNLSYWIFQSILIFNDYECMQLLLNIIIFLLMPTWLAYFEY